MSEAARKLAAAAPPPPQIRTLAANRKWGRGRTEQLATRFYCKLRGHKSMPWFFDWPYDVPADCRSERDPDPNEMLTWARGCHRMCGHIETAEVRLADSETLPGVVGNIYDNPTRGKM